MSQLFKSAYFPDCPGARTRRPSLTIAFGQNDVELHTFLPGTPRRNLTASRVIRSFTDRMGSRHDEALF